jgi:hypothetical protein
LPSERYAAFFAAGDVSERKAARISATNESG